MSEGVQREFEHAQRLLKQHTAKCLRLERLQQALEAATARGGAVALSTLGDEYRVTLTPQTTECAARAVTKSLRNHIDMIHTSACATETPHTTTERRPDHAVDLSRLLKHAPDALWSVLQHSSVDRASVYPRACAVADDLWREHAVAAVFREQHVLQERRRSLLALSAFCSRLARICTNAGEDSQAAICVLHRQCRGTVHAALGKVQQMWQSRLKLAYLGAAADGPLCRLAALPAIDNAQAVTLLVWFLTYGVQLSRFCGEAVERIDALLACEPCDAAWHGVALVRDAEQTGAVSGAAVLQPPAHTQVFGTGERVRLVALPASSSGAVQAVPVVRACHVLRLLIQEGHLDLGLLSVEQMLKIVDAELYQYRTCIGRIKAALSSVYDDAALVALGVDDADAESRVSPFDHLVRLGAPSSPEASLGDAPPCVGTAVDRVAAEFRFDYVVIAAVAEWVRARTAQRGVQLQATAGDVIALLRRSCPSTCMPSAAGLAQRVPLVLGRLATAFDAAAGSDFFAQATALQARVTYAASETTSPADAAAVGARTKKAKVLSITGESSARGARLLFCSLCTRILLHLESGAPLPRGVQWSKTRSARKRATRGAAAQSDP